jgi:hypothetical protein
MSVIKDTTIYIASFAIHEPVTTVTDFIISGICVYFYFKLNKLSANNPSTNYWKYFYGFMALGSFIGGCAHAFFEFHVGLGYKSFWLSMQVLNMLAMYSIQHATLNSALIHSNKKNIWAKSYLIQALVGIMAVFLFQNFIVVVINNAIALIPIMIIHFKASKTNKLNLWIAYGIAVLFVTAGVNLAKLSLHDYFNHLDLAHVLIMINLYLMYTGVRKKAIAM